MQCERLMNDFMNVLNRLQAAKRKAASREKIQIKSVTMEDEQLHVQRQTGDDPIQLQHLQQQHQMNLNEIKERQQVSGKRGKEIQNRAKGPSRSVLTKIIAHDML